MAQIHKGGLFQICGLFKSIDCNKRKNKPVMLLRAAVIGPQLMYEMDHAYLSPWTENKLWI